MCKVEEELGHVHHAGALIHHNQSTGAHDGAGFSNRIIIYRSIGHAGRNHTSGWPPHLNCFEIQSFRGSAADIKDYFLQGYAHWHLYQPAASYLACQGKDLGALALLSAKGVIGVGSVEHDPGYVSQGLHIIYVGRFTP